jgi:hypothetical protein
MITRELLLNELKALRLQEAEHRLVADKARSAADAAAGAVSVLEYLLGHTESKPMSQGDLEEVLGGKVVNIKGVGGDTVSGKPTE